jgi:hypothetical protein
MMNINNWRKDFLNMCKYCNFFYDTGRNRYRYRCEKFDSSIYKAYGCAALLPLMESAAEISKKAIDDAFEALVSPIY